MGSPTREEIDRVLAALHRMRQRRDLYDGEAADLQAAYDLLHAYPLPPEDGERGDAEAALDRLAKIIRDEAVQIGNRHRGSRGELDDLLTYFARYERAAVLLRQPPPAPPSGVDREADDWRYLPELPPEDDRTAQYLAAGTDEGVPTVWLAPFTAAEIRAARAGFYAWRPAPEPPPLPEAKP